MSTFFYTPSDTGVTHTETIVSRRTRIMSDTGVAFSESLARQRRAVRVLTDTGSTISSNFSWFRTLADTGITSSDVVPTASVRPADNATFTYLCSRNWNFIENQSGWTVNAYQRFTYTTIPD